MRFSKFSHTIALLVQITPALSCFGHARRDDAASNGTNDQFNPTIATRIKPAVPTGKTALTNVRVFDGYVIRHPSTIVIDGETISEDLTGVDSVIDGNGGVLLPGLFDSHCHPDSISILETLSSYGVTTALSMNCYDYTVCSSLRDQTGLTSFFTAGFSAKGLNSSHARNSNTPDSELIQSPDQAPQYVQNVFSNGSDYLKIVSEENGPDQATQNALVAYAHALGKRVMTHAATLSYYDMAVESGTDGPQHLPYDGLLNSTTVLKMHSQRQYATPTLNLYQIVLQIPGGATALGQEPIAFDTAWSTLTQNVRALKEAGVPILAGTDASPPYAGLSIPFGETVHDEMRYLVEAGLTAAEALRAATLTPSLTHGLEDRGRIEAGKRADLVLLRVGADPLANISDTRKIARVWIGGLEYAKIA